MGFARAHAAVAVLRCSDSADRRPPALQAATDATICANGDASVALVVRAAYAAADALVLRAGCHQALWPTPGSPAAAFAAACSRTAHALLPPL